MGAGLKILAWFDLKVFVTINFPAHLAELDPALWGGENSLSLSDSLCDVNCNKSWLTICHGVHVQHLGPLSVSSITEDRSASITVY